MKKYRLGALLAAGALLLSLASTALATSETKFNWQGNGYPNASCNANSSNMLWIWTGDSPDGLTINGIAQSGSWTQMGKGSWHWTVDINKDNFAPTSASIMYSGGSGVLTLSGCDESTSPSPTPSESAPVQSESSSPSESPSASTPVQSESVPPSDGPTPSASASDGPTPSASASASPTPSASASDSPSPTPSESASASASPTPSESASQPASSPSGSVLGATGTPQITPPPTDALGAAQGSAGSGLPLVLAAVSALLLAALAVTPSRRRSRR